MKLIPEYDIKLSIVKIKIKADYEYLLTIRIQQAVEAESQLLVNFGPGIFTT